MMMSEIHSDISFSLFGKLENIHDKQLLQIFTDLSPQILSQNQVDH